MSSLVLGIGIGSFLLACIWISTFILCIIAIRTKKLIGFIALLTATFITIILFVVPKQSQGEAVTKQEESDYNLIWHNLLATIFGLCSLGSIALFIIEYAIEPIKPKLINTWIVD